MGKRECNKNIPHSFCVSPPKTFCFSFQAFGENITDKQGFFFFKKRSFELPQQVERSNKEKVCQNKWWFEGEEVWEAAVGWGVFLFFSYLYLFFSIIYQNCIPEGAGKRTCRQ